MVRVTFTKGMTLIEMLVVIGIYTVLMGAIFSSVQALYKYNAYSLAQANEVDNARRAMGKLTKDLREMTSAEDGTFPLVVKGPHRIGFYSDIDSDDSVEYIEYELVATNFYKRIHNAVGWPPTYNFTTPDKVIIVSDFVQNNLQSTSTFMYYDTNGVLLPAGALLTQVRYIRSQIIVNIDPLRSPGEFMLRSSIAPRNLKDNL